MKKYLVSAALTLGLAVSANAATIDITEFDNPTVIDFETLPAGAIGNFYAGLTFVNLYGGYTYDTGHGNSKTATNFTTGSSSPYTSGTICWDSIITQVGFDITTNYSDDISLTAFFATGGSIVGSHDFVTGGAGGGGTFIGMEFASGFDSITIGAYGGNNGAFAMDNLRYGGGTSPDPVPEPATMLLMGTGLAGLLGYKKRKAAKK